MAKQFSVARMDDVWDIAGTQYCDRGNPEKNDIIKSVCVFHHFVRKRKMIQYNIAQQIATVANDVAA